MGGGRVAERFFEDEGERKASTSRMTSVSRCACSLLLDPTREQIIALWTSNDVLVKNVAHLV